MACMEHICRWCDATVFSNGPAPSVCPECGYVGFDSHWDEEAVDYKFGDLPGDEKEWGDA